MTDSGFIVSDDLADHIANMLLALADVSDGNFDVQLQLDLPEDHPIGALSLGINQMTQSLASERRDALRLQRELEEKLALIERQRVAMRELSTPIIEVWEGVLCLPVVGVVDTVRSAEMTDSLLQAVVAKSVDCAIVDITGIDVMDTRTANHFLRMSRAVHLLGARCMLSGVNPNIAQTMVHMGVDMQGVEFYRSLRDALQLHLPALAKEEAAMNGDSFNPLPIMKLWGTLLVPLQGEVNDELAERIHSEVLDKVYQSDVDNIIIDITGLWLLDSHICAMLAGLGSAARLMGARTVICGMSAEIAQTLQMMDIGLESLDATLNVEEAFELVGLRVSRAGTVEKEAVVEELGPSEER